MRCAVWWILLASIFHGFGASQSQASESLPVRVFVLVDTFNMSIRMKSLNGDSYINYDLWTLLQEGLRNGLTFLQPYAHLGIILYHDSVQIIGNLTDIGYTPVERNGVIDQMFERFPTLPPTQVGNSSNLCAALNVSFNALRNRESLVDDHIVIVTRGYTNVSCFNQYKEEAVKLKLKMHVHGFAVEGSANEALKLMSSVTGNEMNGTFKNVPILIDSGKLSTIHQSELYETFMHNVSTKMSPHYITMTVQARSERSYTLAADDKTYCFYAVQLSLGSTVESPGDFIITFNGRNYTDADFGGYPSNPNNNTRFRFSWWPSTDEQIALLAKGGDVTYQLIGGTTQVQFYKFTTEDKYFTPTTSTKASTQNVPNSSKNASSSLSVISRSLTFVLALIYLSTVFL